MKNNRKNIAVSDVVGTVLLLGITVALFSTLCIGVLSYPSSPSLPKVDLVATIQGEYLIIEHRGGEALDLDTKVIITVGENQPIILIVGEEDYLSEDAKQDDKWGIGEGFLCAEYNLQGKKVKISVVDVTSNSMILSGYL